MKIRSIQVTENDNVATVLRDSKKFDIAEIYNKDNQKISEIVLLSDIPYGSKLALIDLEKDASIIKYNHRIGHAISIIRKGEIVHVHNVDSDVAIIPESVRLQVVKEMGIEG